MSNQETRIEEIAYGLFGNYFRLRREKFSKLRNNLLRARIFVAVEKWLSKAVFYSIIVAIVAGACFFLLKGLISLALLSEFPLLNNLIPTMALALLSFVGTFAGFYMLPNIRAWEKRGKIDELLPYAIGYISAMASIGVYPYEIFKKLSKEEEIYGEVSQEAKRVVRDVELLGFDFITALKKLIATTPSDHMRAFVQGAVTSALSGGEMGEYFVNTARTYMEERRKMYQDFIETLGLFAEFYVIGLVVAPLLLVVVLAIMLFLGGASLAGLAAIIYLVIPLGSAGFIFLIGTLSE